MKDRHRKPLVTQRMQREKRSENKEVVLDSFHAIAAWIHANPKRIARIEYSPPVGRRTEALVAAARARGIECTERVGPSRGVAGSTTGRLIAWCRPFPYCDLEALALADRSPAAVVLLDHVMDPRNVGAIIRTAAAVGCAAVVLPVDRACPVTAEVERASAGASALVPVARVVNLVRALHGLKREGFWVVALDGRGSQNVLRDRMPEKAAIVLGGETGVSRLVLGQADHVFRIPMTEGIESLNVSVAAGIALYAWASAHVAGWKPATCTD